MATPTISSLNDFNNICRICLKKKPYMISIFKKILSPHLPEELNIVYNLQSYSEMIEACTSIQILDNDLFPKNLCKFCSKQLEQSYNLKIQCLSSTKTLQNFLTCWDKSQDIKLFTENNDSNINETKNETIEAIEKVVKQEIIEDESKINISNDDDESKINISNDDDESKINISNDDDENMVLDNSFNYEVITKEEAEKDSVQEMGCKNEINEGDDNDKELKCKVCSDRFISNVQLTNHFKQLHLKTRIKCEFCTKIYLNNKSYRNHLYRLKKRCKLCSEEFKCKSKFINHMKECITCKKCGETYYHKTRNTPHTCLKVDLQEKPCLLCPCCGKTFAEKWNFEQHMIRHKNERSHQCKICDSKFNTSNLLKVHLIAHTNEKPHECDVCKKSYKYASSLRRHNIVSHTNYGLPCNFCDKLFKSKDSLRKHQLVHTGERKFVCTYCSKPFGRHDNLQMHLRIHTGEKPFVCDKCGTGFSAKHVLRGHMKTHDR